MNSNIFKPNDEIITEVVYQECNKLLKKRMDAFERYGMTPISEKEMQDLKQEAVTDTITRLVNSN